MTHQVCSSQWLNIFYRNSYVYYDVETNLFSGPFCWARVWEFRFGFSKNSVAGIVWNKGFSELTRFDRTTCCNLIGIPQNWTLVRIPQEWILWPCHQNSFGSSEKKRLGPSFLPMDTAYHLSPFFLYEGKWFVSGLKLFPTILMCTGSDFRVYIFVWTLLLNFMAIFVCLI